MAPFSQPSGHSNGKIHLLNQWIQYGPTIQENNKGKSPFECSKIITNLSNDQTQRNWMPCLKNVIQLYMRRSSRPIGRWYAFVLNPCSLVYVYDTYRFGASWAPLIYETPIYIGHSMFSGMLAWYYFSLSVFDSLPFVFPEINTSVPLFFFWKCEHNHISCHLQFVKRYQRIRCTQWVQATKWV